MSGLARVLDPPRADVPRADLPRPPGRRRWPAHWPLTALCLGFPLWWVLGIHNVMLLAVAIPMALQLLAKPKVILPRGFVFWLLFLVWVALGAFMLWADAPGAIPGGGPARILPWAHRFGVYTAVTVALVWVLNTSELELTRRRIQNLFGYLFVVTCLGGLLGVLAPTLDFPSALELVLPAGLADNAYVSSLVHPGVADVQTVLGRPEARPKAPFAFTNSWGSNLSLFLPFFLYAWVREGTHWQRVAAPAVLAVAAVPVVYSLNRGLWASLALGGALMVLLALRRGRPLVIGLSLASVLLVLVAVAASPLASVFQERLDNQHSNERRGQLLTQTVTSTVQGSPVLGFGSTRNVQGSFASIAGAATPSCSACGVPPLGTQGQLWLVIFSQGLVGAAFFLAFFAIAFSRCWRARTPAQTICTFVLAFLGLQVFVYDTLGMPLLTAMVAIALVAREKATASARRGRRELSVGELVGAVRRWTPVITLLAVAGTAVGTTLAARLEPQFAAKTNVLLAPSPTYFAPPDATFPIVPTDFTIDTEAALVVSQRALDRVAEATGMAVQDIRESIRVTARPSSRVLIITVTTTSPDVAATTVQLVSEAYLDSRRQYLRQRRNQQAQLYRERLRALGATPEQGTIEDDPADLVSGRRLARDQVQAALTQLSLSSANAGEVIRVIPAVPARRPTEVYVGSGFALGLMLGYAAAVRSLRSPGTARLGGGRGLGRILLAKVRSGATTLGRLARRRADREKRVRTGAGG